MSREIDKYAKEYSEDYFNGGFENIMVKYRKRKIIELIKKYSTKNILEIGCGMTPFFLDYNEFEHMVIIEAAKTMYENALKCIDGDNRIKCINDYAENCIERLQDEEFDVILLSGVLQEVEDPDGVLKCVKAMCNKNTKVVIVCNNPNSFHRLLAFESNIISSVTEMSERSIRHLHSGIYSLQDMEDKVKQCGFSVIETGTFFIKPFTHSQLEQMLKYNIINEDIIEGFDGMIKYMPELGAEYYLTVQLEQ